MSPISANHSAEAATTSRDAETLRSKIATSALRVANASVTSARLTDALPRGLCIELLFQPATYRIGSQWIDAEVNFWMRVVCLEVESALSRLLKRRVELAWVNPDASPSGRSFVFTTTLTHTALDSSLTLHLDEKAARLLIDPLLEEFAGLRGDGLPTPAERAILEYILLVVYDTILNRFSPHLDDIRIDGFLGQDDAVNQGEDGNGFAVFMKFSTLGGEGLIQLVVTKAWLERLSTTALGGPSMELCSSSDTNSSLVALHVALEPISVSRTEFVAITPGDLLVCGGHDLASMQGRLNIISETGWQMSRVEQIADFPTHLDVLVGPLRLPPIPAEAHRLSTRGSAKHLILPLVGSVSASRSQLDSWTEGQMISFAKNPAAPVLLACGGICCGSGEFVLHEGELCIRVIEFRSSYSE